VPQPSKFVHLDKGEQDLDARVKASHIGGIHGSGPVLLVDLSYFW
jgi:hypothetical protein